MVTFSVGHTLCCMYSVAFLYVNKQTNQVNCCVIVISNISHVILKPKTSKFHLQPKIVCINMPSAVANRDRDCFSCRMVSGSGLIGIGGYLAYHGRRNPTNAGKFIIGSLAIGKKRIKKKKYIK